MAHSNEAVCSNKTCLAMAHSSELLQLAAVRSHQLSQTHLLGSEPWTKGQKHHHSLRWDPHFPLHHWFPSPPPQTFPLIKSRYSSGYRVMEHRVASSFLRTVHIRQGLISFSFTWITVQRQPRSLPLCGLRTKWVVKEIQEALFWAKHFPPSFLSLVKRSFQSIYIHSALSN